MGFLQEIFADFNLKDILSDNKEKKIITPTPELILGYSLYPEQQNWIDFCFAKDSKQVKMLLGARGYGKTEVITKYAVIKYLIEHQAENPSFIILTRSQKRSKAILYSISSILKDLKEKADTL